jgi:hypothetical protein
MLTASNGKRRRVVVRPYSLRASETRQAAQPEPGDELVGGWPREQLIRMDADFCAAMERAISRGLERRPQEGRKRAA